jgi:hypothetical protein
LGVNFAISVSGDFAQTMIARRSCRCLAAAGFCHVQASERQISNPAIG